MWQLAIARGKIDALLNAALEVFKYEGFFTHFDDLCETSTGLVELEILQNFETQVRETTCGRDSGGSTSRTMPIELPTADPATGYLRNCIGSAVEGSEGYVVVLAGDILAKVGTGNNDTLAGHTYTVAPELVPVETLAPGYHRARSATYAG